jgi:hypothetical protein
MTCIAADGEPAAITADGYNFTSFGMRMLVELLPPAAASLDEELLNDGDEPKDEDPPPPGAPPLGSRMLLDDDSELLDDDEEPKDEDPPPPGAPPLGSRMLLAASSLETNANDFTRTKPRSSSLLASASFGTATRSI